jgi:hypothetical protein
LDVLYVPRQIRIHRLCGSQFNQPICSNVLLNIDCCAVKFSLLWKLGFQHSSMGSFIVPLKITKWTIVCTQLHNNWRYDRFLSEKHTALRGSLSVDVFFTVSSSYRYQSSLSTDHDHVPYYRHPCIHDVIYGVTSIIAWHYV